MAVLFGCEHMMLSGATPLNMISVFVRVYMF